MKTIIQYTYSFVDTKKQKNNCQNDRYRTVKVRKNITDPNLPGVYRKLQ